MIFGSRGKQTIVQFKIDGTVFEVVDKIRFLGVIIDNPIRWKDHIEFVGNKIARNISVMYI